MGYHAPTAARPLHHNVLECLDKGGRTRVEEGYTWTVHALAVVGWLGPTHQVLLEPVTPIQEVSLDFCYADGAKGKAMMR